MGLIGESSQVVHVDEWSDLGQWLQQELVGIHVHDQPYMGAWVCGACPYMNVGPICTKCGAPAWEGVFIGGVAVGP